MVMVAVVLFMVMGFVCVMSNLFSVSVMVSGFSFVVSWLMVMNMVLVWLVFVSVVVPLVVGVV